MFEEINRRQYMKTYQKIWHNIHKDRIKIRESEPSRKVTHTKHRIKRMYSLNYIEYLRLHIKQDFKCGICNKYLPSGKLKSIDHCHETGKVRGLLCSNCNQGLGMFKESLDIFNSAIYYIRKHNV